MFNWIGIYPHTRGKPTRFAPIPKPAPVRADAPTDGAYTSSTANVAKATSAIIPTSANASLPRLGIRYAATATARPSSAYFTRREMRSLISSPGTADIFIEIQRELFTCEFAGWISDFSHSSDSCDSCDDVYEFADQRQLQVRGKETSDEREQLHLQVINLPIQHPRNFDYQPKEHSFYYEARKYPKTD